MLRVASLPETGAWLKYLWLSAIGSMTAPKTKTPRKP
jgi:hypothetical protein